MGVNTLENFNKTRPNHVCLIKQREIAIVGVADPRVVAVDLAQLDPCLMDPDEDLVAEKFPEMVTFVPLVRPLTEAGEEEAGQHGALAAWAESAPDFDRSEVTERSIAEDGLAYRGVIPPRELDEIAIPSPSILGFEAGLPDDLRSRCSMPTVRLEDGGLKSSGAACS